MYTDQLKEKRNRKYLPRETSRDPELELWRMDCLENRGMIPPLPGIVHERVRDCLGICGIFFV